MADSPQMAAYKHMPAQGNGPSILRNGGVWQVRDPLPPTEDRISLVGPHDAFKIHEFKARPRGRFGEVYHEVYSVETGEVVGRIN